MIIETKRCLIRPFEEDDLEAFMIYRNNEEWMQFQGFKNLSKTEYREALIKALNIKEGIQVAIIKKDDGALLGDLYLHQDKKELWIGYTISPVFSRQGYASEVVESMIEHYKDSDISSLHAGVIEENDSSIKLLEKIGFVDTKIIDDGEKYYIYNLINGKS